ncbi:MAG: hypothetical protein QM737_16615 [Ferruginibacter sp.]
MNDSLSNDFTGEDQSKLPSGLNVLTILTIIGSIIGLIFSVYGFFTAKTNYERTKDLMNSPEKMEAMPGWAKGMITPEGLAMQQKMMENKLPILILSLVALALCLYGAMEMRKRKKQGYILWLIGEILPIGTSLLFIGTMAMKGFGLMMVFIPILFIILYTVNKKELIY